MIGRLRSEHQHRFELPLVAPGRVPEPRDVPLDPYALGLLLGDGCITTRTTPTFTTADEELAEGAGSPRCPAIALGARAPSTTCCNRVEGAVAAA